MDKLKATAVAIAVLGAGAFASQDLTVRQELYKAGHGKYEQFAKDKFKKGMEVHEYVRPDGTPGYQVIEQEQRPDGLYERSFGSGPEAASRSFDWTLVQPTPTKSATST